MPNVKLVPGLMTLLRAANDRKARTAAASAEMRPDTVAAMARRMHPEALKLIVTAVQSETETVKTYRLGPDEGMTLPVFQAGQYISVKLDVGGSCVSRAYSISSAPYEAEGSGGYYEITVRHKENGLVSGAVWDTWTTGTRVSATGPHGDFYVSPLRDTDEIIAIAGGSGITPFRSMMKQFAKEEPRLL